jgi:hypothetical protein
MEKLFNTVINYGYYVRLNGIKGLEAWNEIKKDINRDDEKNIKLSSKINKWNISVNINNKKTTEIPIIYNYFKYEMNLHGDENDREQYKIDEKTWEINHFYLQLIRIPKNNGCNIQRLLQIGYNIGQLVCEMKRKRVSEEQIKFFIMNRLYSMNTYVRVNLYILTTEMLDYISEIKSEIMEKIKKINKKEYYEDISETITETISENI